MNVFTGIGRAGRDAEVRHTSNGKQVMNVGLAIDSGFGDNKQTNWYSVSIWDGLAKTNFVDYLNKGQQVMVVGELSTREYNGKTYLEIKRVYDIKLCGGQAQQSKPQQAAPQQQPKPQADLDSDLPF